MSKVSFEVAAKKVENKEWIGHFECVRSIVEYNSKDKLPKLSIGSNSNLYYEIDHSQYEQLVAIGIDVKMQDNGVLSCMINTNEDFHWTTICNFRRYGWCSAPGRNAEYGYSGIIFANGQMTYPLVREMNDSMFLRVELSRLVGELIGKGYISKYVSNSYALKKGLDLLAKEASEHLQSISYGSKEDFEEISFIDNK